MPSPQLLRWVPLLFVLLWSTGFIGAKYTLPYAEPFTLLAIRMYITLLLFLLLIRHFRASWPKRTEAFHAMVVGALVHAAYLGGVFSAIEAGMSAGLASLLMGMQPILTALIAWVWMDSRISIRQSIGLLLGIGGVATVLLSTQGEGLSWQFSQVSLLFAAMALLGITIGTLYQKRFCAGIDLLTGTFFQFLASALVLTLMSFAFETREVIWNIRFIAGLSWLVLVLSVGAILLLMLMIREGESTKVAAYFYLTPPVTALIAWLTFGERVSMIGLIGIALTTYGVYLVIRTPKPAGEISNIPATNSPMAGERK